jgi:glutamyl-tRNA synthetase
VPDRDLLCTDGHYGDLMVNLSRQVGDFIIRRKDGAWAYQLAVVIDDALMGVTEVVRGRDLLLSTPQQMYVADLLGFPIPQFIHFPLLCNSEGQRLSKRDKSLDMECLRQHQTARQLIGRLAFLAGIIPTPDAISAQELLPLFSWERVPKEDIIVVSSGADSRDKL